MCPIPTERGEIYSVRRRKTPNDQTPPCPKVWSLGVIVKKNLADSVFQRRALYFADGGKLTLFYGEHRPAFHRAGKTASVMGSSHVTKGALCPLKHARGYDTLGMPPTLSGRPH